MVYITRNSLSKFQTWIILNNFDKKTALCPTSPKYTCLVKFDNTALELIWFPQILNLLEVVFELTDKLQNNDNNPTVKYQLD